MKRIAKTRHLLLLIVLVAISTVLFSLCISFREIMEMDAAATANDNGYVFYSLQHESNPLDNEISEFKELYDKLINRSENAFTYYEVYQQHLEISPDQTGIPLDDDGQIECVQIGKTVLSDFDISLYRGRMLNENDFLLDDKAPIPVLLGYSYSNTFEVGDTFCCKYLFDSYDFCVIGFLESGAKFTISGVSIPLDTFIMMPSFDISDKAPTTNGLKIHYANKTSGFVKATLEQSDYVYETINNLLQGNWEYTIGCSSIDVGMQNRIGIGLKGVSVIILAISLLMLLISIWCATEWRVIKLSFLTAFFTGSICLSLMFRYLVQLLCGIRIGSIYLLVIATLLCFILSLLMKLVFHQTTPK